MMATTYRVTLTPIEPLLFTDNRSARAGEDHLIQDQDPSPHTLFGSISAYIAGQLGATIEEKDWNAKVKDFLGKFEPNIQSGSTDRAELMGYIYQDVEEKFWFPRPLHFRVNQSGDTMPVIPSQKPLKPKKLNENLTASSLKDFESFLDGEYEPYEVEMSDLVSKDILQNLLTNESIPATQTLDINTNRLPVGEIYRNEIRLGLGMYFKKNVTITGRLFSRPYRRFSSKVIQNSGNWQSAGFVAFYKSLRPITNGGINEQGITFLGGDRGRAIINVEPLNGEEKPLIDLMNEVQDKANGSEGFFCYLLTPAVREKDLSVIKDQKPIAVAIGKSQTVSGWNTTGKQHPRPILRLIPSGSTFFYRWPTSNNFDRKKFIEEYWLEPITTDTSNHYRNSGFGRILIGVWS